MVFNSINAAQNGLRPEPHLVMLLSSTPLRRTVVSASPCEISSTRRGGSELMKPKEECPSPSCNRCGRYEGVVSGKPQSRQSREVVSKLQDNRSSPPGVIRGDIQRVSRLITKEIKK